MRVIAPLEKVTQSLAEKRVSGGLVCIDIFDLKGGKSERHGYFPRQSEVTPDNVFRILGGTLRIRMLSILVKWQWENWAISAQCGRPIHPRTMEGDLLNRPQRCRGGGEIGPAYQVPGARCKASSHVTSSTPGSHC